MSALLGLLNVVPLRAWLVAGGIAAAALAGGYVIHSAYQRGRAAGATVIEETNHANEKRADRSGDVVERCYAGGGRWDRFERVCLGARQ
ncbi:hypothetical protein [Labrys wisconsinensis]|uniref:Uncharacterized protein n=1 Tax=Labrys wisconsinensis TaxID=425677 RepID=A0ABU0JEY6_9HYPH|nr:hypothetical protein [Labrys wisconsinensis]MDQ0472839.1 hypothetical protein [Labrys wisconsinensis]